MVCSPGVWFGPSCCGQEGGPLPTSAPRAPGSTPQVSLSREAGSSDTLRRGGHKQQAHLRRPTQAVICLRVGFGVHSAQEEARLPAASPPLGPEGGMPAREGGRCSPPSWRLCNTGGRKRQTPRGFQKYLWCRCSAGTRGLAVAGEGRNQHPDTFNSRGTCLWAPRPSHIHSPDSLCGWGSEGLSCS